VNEAAYAALDGLLAARIIVLMLGELISLGFFEILLEFLPLSLQKHFDELAQIVLEHFQLPETSRTIP
jgi:hypothetical protein